METLGTITLHNADCMDVMRNMPDKAFDLAIADPPYGIAGSPSRHGGSGAGKLKNRVLNRNARQFKEWDVPPADEYFAELFRVSKNQIIWGGNYFHLPPSRCVICWDKCQPWQNFSQWEMAWTSFDAPAKLFRFDNRTGDKIHPTQKPIELYSWLLAKFARPGDKILDTHLGSGSSAIACLDAGFEMTGIEIDAEYYAAAIRRINASNSQQRLF